MSLAVEMKRKCFSKVDSTKYLISGSKQHKLFQQWTEMDFKKKYKFKDKINLFYIRCKHN